MAVAADFRSESDQRRRWLAPAVIACALLLAAWLLWTMMHARTGVSRPAAPQTSIDLLPPPPPPPPPPPEQQPPPKPEPVNQPTPAPTPAPQQPQAPAPVSIAGPAQAGTDAFGVQSGSGGGIGSPGSVGTCVGTNCGQGGGGVGDAFYRRYLGSALEAALRQDKSVNRRTFNVTVLIWVSPAGAVTRADMVTGTGSDKTDDAVVASLRNVASLEAPNGIRFPQRVIVRGTRGI